MEIPDKLKQLYNHWENTEKKGVFVHSLSNTFDDDYKRLLELYPSTRNP